MNDEPALGYLFDLVIDGVELGGFSGVDGISASYDVTEVKEGGENAFVHALPGRVKYSNVTLSRAIDQSSQRLAGWFTEYQTLIATGGRHRPMSASVSALNAGHQTIARWQFADVVPIKYTGPSFDATSPKLAMEKFEFAHQGFWSGTSPMSVAG